MNATKKFQITAIAHCSSGYDAQFILQHCSNNIQKPEKALMSGTKITYLSVLGVRFIDSFKFLPMPLSKIPEAFGLSTTLRKGDFPHFFNVKENWNYIGPIPDIEYYGLNHKSVKEKEKILKWWQGLRDENYTFDFQ